jgi:hypothetical protein
LSPFEARLDFPSQPDWLGIYIALPYPEGKRSGFKPIRLLRCFSSVQPQPEKVACSILWLVSTVLE